jgi:hypothetical protein
MWSDYGESSCYLKLLLPSCKRLKVSTSVKEAALPRIDRFCMTDLHAFLIEMVACVFIIDS